MKATLIPATMMMMIKFKIPSLQWFFSCIRHSLLFALLFFFCSFSSIAQVNDFQTWTSLGIATDISKRFSAGLGSQLRMINNSSLPGSVFVEPDLTFKLNKYIRFSASYRLSFKMGNDKENSTRHRYNIDVEGRKKIGKFTLKLRAGFQKGFTDIIYNENREPYSYPAYNRNKLSLGFEASKTIDPFAEFEIFLPLNDPRQRNFDFYRATVGSSFNLKNRNSLDCFFRIQKELNTANPETDYIIGLGYTYDLKFKTKKEKEKEKKKVEKKEKKKEKGQDGEKDKEKD